MKKIGPKKICSIFIILFLLASCKSSKIYFTPGLKARLDKEKVSLKEVQFYNDKTVILKSEIDSAKAKATTLGKVIVENGKYVNIIKLKANTPGKCINESSNRLDIAFEYGDNRVLSFGTDFNDGSRDYFYKLYADEWVDGFGKINYNDTIYFIQPGGGQTKLMVKKSDLFDFKVSKRTMKGQKFD